MVMEMTGRKMWREMVVVVWCGGVCELLGKEEVVVCASKAFDVSIELFLCAHLIGSGRE